MGKNEYINQRQFYLKFKKTYLFLPIFKGFLRHPYQTRIPRTGGDWSLSIGQINQVLHPKSLQFAPKIIPCQKKRTIFQPPFFRGELFHFPGVLVTVSSQNSITSNIRGLKIHVKPSTGMLLPSCLETLAFSRYSKYVQ